MTPEIIIGYLACVNVSVLQLPQVYKTYYSKQADDLSWGMVFLNLIGSILWFCYGILIMKNPIIISNCFYFLANITLLTLKCKYSKTIEPKV